MPLAAGARLGSYEIVEPIGKGGMGEVYRARDTKLQREVAIKVLPDEFASDAEHIATISPDGRWLAYESNDSGRFEIHVRPFPNVDEGQWLISSDGGTKPVWAPNGRELFYMAPGSRLMAVPVETAPGFTPGSATELFSGYFTGLPGPTYDISRDGERFLMIKEDAAGDEAFILVQNWFEELKRLVPAQNN